MTNWTSTVKIKHFILSASEGEITSKEMLTFVADTLQSRLLPRDWENPDRKNYEEDEYTKFDELDSIISDMKHVDDDVTVDHSDELLHWLYDWADAHQVWVS